VSIILLYVIEFHLSDYKMYFEVFYGIL